jgi:energy-coupling factor transport system permease protein
MFVDYYPGATIIHRLDVRAKLVAFTALMVLLFFFTNPLYNLLLAVFSTFLLFYLGLPIRKISAILRPVAPILLFIMLITAFTYPAENFVIPAAKVVFYKKGWFEISSGGVLYGATLVLRIFNMVILSSILTCSTPLDHFLQVMKMSRLPSNVSFLIITGIRFVPTMQKKVEMVFNAQKVRGANFDEKGLFSRVKAYIPIMVPLLVQSLYMSDRLAVAMLNRGYGAAARQTSLEEISMNGLDYIFIMLFMAVTVVGIYLRVQGIGRL